MGPCEAEGPREQGSRSTSKPSASSAPCGLRLPSLRPRTPAGVWGLFSGSESSQVGCSPSPLPSLTNPLLPAPPPHPATALSSRLGLPQAQFCLPRLWSAWLPGLPSYVSSWSTPGHPAPTMTLGCGHSPKPAGTPLSIAIASRLRKLSLCFSRAMTGLEPRITDPAPSEESHLNS
jgi:hypothetical protein